MDQLDKKKLPVNDAIVMMADAINKNDTARFYKVIEQYADNFVRGSGTRWTLINAIKNRPMHMKTLDTMDNKIKQLLIQSEGSDENVFVNESMSFLVDELLIEWANIPVYQYHNLKVRNKILLHGITGNGKTTIAKYIAKKSNLPFVEVKSDEVIDSHLGNTGANVWKIFNNIKEPCILFWDEVDSIGCKRGNDVKSSAGLENDRMTNSILINLEKLSDEVVFIAATNRKEVLDSAFLRRFDLQFEIMPPTEAEKEMFVKQLTAYYKLECDMPDLSLLNSYSEIKNQFVQLARTSVLETIRKNATAIAN